MKTLDNGADQWDRSPTRPCKRWVVLLGISLLGFTLGWAAPDAARLARGQELYARNCFACHQLDGAGVAGVFPPLAKSDYFAKDVERGLRVVVEGLTGEVVVNGHTFTGAMPPVIISDEEVADVFTYVLNSWGNPGGEISATTVRQVRGRTKLKTFEQLKAASVFPPLPKAPDGFTLREVVRLPQRGVRLASDGTGRTLFVLCETGDVWELEIASGNMRQFLWASRYLEKRRGDVGAPLFVLAMARDREGHLYIGSNQQNDATLPVQNIVTIYRTTTFVDGRPAEPKVWFQTSYPGNGGYVHGLEHIAFGPDGMLYANNGARTDGGQASKGPRWYDGGETPVTACLWRIDPRAEKPTFEVYARGLRNAFGFCWNDRGELFATENAPTAHAPEELNLIEQGKHYGYPYRFGDWEPTKLFPETPAAPAGLEFTKPIPNLGPDGGFAGKAIATFDPHSSPGGIVFLGDDFPPGYRGTFVLARFGSMTHERFSKVGYDVLQVVLDRDAAGHYQAHTHTLLAPLGRPLDVHLSGRGKIYICEYTRAIDSTMSIQLPGRILELAVSEK